MEHDLPDYRLVRAARKTIALTVRPDGTVEVRAPRWVSRAQADRFVAQKRDWIDRRRRALEQAARARGAFRLEPGGTLPLLGRETPIVAAARTGADDRGFCVRADRPVKPQIIECLRQIARRELEARIARYAPGLGVRPASLRITSASTRYGSCSGKNALSFTWKLVMASPELIDYVAVHELCHIREHNHSARFWALVARTLPDYREREARLREFGARLALQDWSPDAAK